MSFLGFVCCLSVVFGRCVDGVEDERTESGIEGVVYGGIETGSE